VTWHDVLERDLRSVYRSRTGTAVGAILALFTVLIAALMGLAPSFQAAAAVGGLVAVVTLVVMVFVGTPRTVAGFVAGFTALTLALTAVLAEPEHPPDPGDAALVIGGALSLVLPLVGLLSSYAAVVGERETGSVRFLLGLPNSREEVYAAKLLSRSAVVVVPLVAGVLLASVIVVATFEPGSIGGVLWVGLVSIPYAVLFVGLGLSASAYAETGGRAVAIAIGVFAVLRAGWPALQWLGLQGMEDTYPRPEWFFWVGRINPINAYVKATTYASGIDEHPLITSPGSRFGPRDPNAEAIAPLVTSHEFAVVVVLAWAVAAPLFGRWYFRRRDLL